MLDMQQAAPDRIYLFDNIKAGLIFLVVLINCAASLIAKFIGRGGRG